jgi:hypothetical protein
MFVKTILIFSIARRTDANLCYGTIFTDAGFTSPWNIVFSPPDHFGGDLPLNFDHLGGQHATAAKDG